MKAKKINWTPENVKALAIKIHGRMYGMIPALYTEMKAIDSLMPEWNNVTRLTLHRWMSGARHPNARNKLILNQIAVKFKFKAK